MPMESNTVTQGVDFNGGGDESFEENDVYENDFDDKPVDKTHDTKITQDETLGMANRLGSVNQSEDFGTVNQTKEYYSKKANEDMQKANNEYMNNQGKLGF